MVLIVVDQKEILRKIKIRDPSKRMEVVEQLTNIFDSLSDREYAWENLVRLASDKNSKVRLSAAKALESIFSHVPDKQKAWEDFAQVDFR